MNRVALLRRGVVLEGVTVGYNALEGIIAIAAGLAAGSVALTGFGIDSVIEVTSGALLWWRLRAELGSAPLGPTVERRAARGAGFLLLALGVYIVADSARLLVTGRRPEASPVGIALTAVGPTNIKATEAEKALAGQELTDETIREAARLAASAADPKDDIRGSAAYKKDVVRVFVQRGLHTALGRAQEKRT